MLFFSSTTYQPLKAPDDVDVKTVMDTWTLQMGYPVVHLTRTGNSIFVTQQRFLLNPKANTTNQNSPFGYKWDIPLTYITDGSATTTTKWMKRTSTSFDVTADTRWIKANKDQKGLYRVHYDSANWQALIQQLLDDHRVFSAADRAGLIEDAFALSRAGILNVSVALDLSEYLIKETDYVPWVTAISNLAYIGKLLEDKASHEHFSVSMEIFIIVYENMCDMYINITISFNLFYLYMKTCIK